ncbi:hypothetical protein D9Q81_00295 [Candidatus Korarchaeum cryptofilum]|uniref:Tubulin/FtsZ GTPase domain-containing protein n=2 Tax=Candidatus Korarchaeum cryptofilum TaxID=498846 RepID=A0A3R9PB98_9CREN|nr:hypothetical protein D9Q81_00295 [Candidatus Korarchaeum cryptofilum]
MEMAVRRRTVDRGLESVEKATEAKINIVGIGGCGNNIISAFYKKFPKNVKTIAVNTDSAVLKKTDADEKVLIGRYTHKGRGAQGVPDIGREAMEEDIETVLRALDENVDIVIGIAGMGGGTGSGGLPVLMREIGLRNKETIKISVVTLPMREEGEERKRNAQFSLKETLETSDVTVVNANDLAMEKAKSVDLNYAFSMVNRKIERSIYALVKMQSSETGPGYVNVDLSNFARISYQSGLGFIGVGRGRYIFEAFDDALQDDYAKSDLTEAKGAIIYFEGKSVDLRVDQMREATDILSRRYRIPTVFMGVRPTFEYPDVRVNLLVTQVRSHYVDDFLAELGL